MKRNEEISKGALDIRVEERGSWSILRLTGDLDLATSPNLREAIIRLIDEGTRQIVVDLSALEFMDSSGLGVLVAALKRVRENGATLNLVAGGEKILKLFRITGLLQVFRIDSSVDGAIES